MHIIFLFLDRNNIKAVIKQYKDSKQLKAAGTALIPEIKQYKQTQGDIRIIVR
jgi:predicted RNA-binding protein with PIN domain